MYFVAARTIRRRNIPILHGNSMKASEVARIAIGGQPVFRDDRLVFVTSGARGGHIGDIHPGLRIAHPGEGMLSVAVGARRTLHFSFLQGPPMDAHLVFVVDLSMASAAHLGDIPPVRLRLGVLRAENQMASMAV